LIRPRVRQKIRRLGLEVVDQDRSVCSTTSKLILPKELPSIEEALSALACPEIGAKWSQFLFSSLGAVLRRTVLLCFFAVAALLERARLQENAC